MWTFLFIWYDVFIKTEIQKLRDEADHKLQEKVRELFKKCEVCGSPCSVGHHIFPKSISSRLRYEMDNIAHLCQGCHMKHHLAGDPRIQEQIKRNRGGVEKGLEWFERLDKLSREYQKVDKYFYMEAIKKLSTVA